MLVCQWRRRGNSPLCYPAQEWKHFTSCQVVSAPLWRNFLNEFVIEEEMCSWTTETSQTDIPIWNIWYLQGAAMEGRWPKEDEQWFCSDSQVISFTSRDGLQKGANIKGILWKCSHRTLGRQLEQCSPQTSQPKAGCWLLHAIDQEQAMRQARSFINRGYFFWYLRVLEVMGYLRSFITGWNMPCSKGSVFGEQNRTNKTQINKPNQNMAFIVTSQHSC